MTQPRAAIVFNSSTGSDTAASGLGPATAVTGTAAAHTNGSASTTITLTNSPDLSGVQAGDLLWLKTASGRQFSVIASVDDGADTVTVDDSFTIDSGSAVDYAIGGKRATLVGSSQILADAKGAWILEMEDGHSESGSFALTASASGSTTDGKITLRGASGATTRPKLSSSTPGTLLTVSGSAWNVHGFDIEVSGVNAEGIIVTGAGTHIFDMRFTATTNNGISLLQLDQSESHVYDCHFNGNDTTGTGIVFKASYQTCERCTITNCGSTGISSDINLSCHVISRCIIAGCGTGVSIGGGNGFLKVVDSCIIYGSTSNGISISGNNTSRLGGHRITRNIITESGAYGINFSTTGASATLWDAEGGYADQNAFYSNTSGHRNNINAGDNDVELSADPFVDAANGDFNINNDAGGGALLRAATVTLP